MTIIANIIGAGTPPTAAKEIAGQGKGAIVALGTNQATATQLGATFNAIAPSSASTGLLLPPCFPGNSCFIYNLSGQTQQIYSQETSGVTMNNAVAGSTGVQLGNTKTAICFVDSVGHWVVTCALTST